MGRASSVTGVLVAAFLLLHLPFVPASLEDLDSVNFALGVREFDVAQHQPHPPGYPVFIGAAKLLRLVTPSEAFALSLLGILSGALSAIALGALYHRLDPAPAVRQYTPAAIALTLTTPLLWINSARPLSDTTGLAAALGVQAFTLAAPGGTGLAVAAFLAGLATGVRSQALWLTLPLLIVMAVRRPPQTRLRDAVVALVALTVGGLLWLAPLVWLSGGPGAYWRAVSSQGSEDLTGAAILLTTHSARQLLLAFNSTFIAPWGSTILAGAALVCAGAGMVRMSLTSRRALGLLAAAFGPYFVFDLLFQETETTKYALPLVVPLTYLMVQGVAALPRRATVTVLSALVAANLAIAIPELQAYASREAPAFRLLRDMRTSAPTLGAPPVLGMHRREAFDMRRSMTWVEDQLPGFSQRLSAPPKYEWLELVKYWNSGGRAPVWFVADPLRSDLALVDHPPPRRYQWPLKFPIFIGGIRPGNMDWYVIESPAWYLGEGWALTPETAGVADASRFGRRRAPSEGWIRRGSEPKTLMIGGRNFAGDGATASITVSVDGKIVAQPTVAPGFFLEMVTVPAGVLAGEGDYGALTVATTGDVAIEQFDAQEPDRVVFGYGEGWHEQEYNPAVGVWRWMSERGQLRVRGTGGALVLTLDGVTEEFSRPSRVTVRAGSRILAQLDLGKRFSVRTELPADLFGNQGREQIVTIETDQMYIPADEQSGSNDQRHLGLKIFDCRIERH